MEDEELWNMLKQGHRDALEKIFRQYVRILYAYGNRFTQDTALVEDCIQDLFQEIWHKRDTLGATDSIKRYLLGALRYGIIRKLRQGASFSSLQDTPSREFQLTLSVEEVLMAEEQTQLERTALQNAILKLTPRQREAVYLRYFQQLSYDEVAKVMHISYQAARNLTYQSLKHLKQYLSAIRALCIVGSTLFF
ncbi:MAG: sigma-70 family RNA polymerase sigma factor [Bacteroidota bacterium]